MTGSSDNHAFLTDMYETEILKTLGIWRAFPDDALEYRPHVKSRSVIEQMEHQVESEERWMRVMLGIETGDPNPVQRNRQTISDKYSFDAMARLAIMRRKPDEWWTGPAPFFDVIRSRAWIVARRIAHSAHHRGQLGVYLRMLDLPLPSVYGPTADTGGKVRY